MLIGSDQKVCGWLSHFNVGIRHQITTGGKDSVLTFRVTIMELGKPVSLPVKADDPQGKLLEVQVREDGESECRFVMGRIAG